MEAEAEGEVAVPQILGVGHHRQPIATQPVLESPTAVRKRIAGRRAELTGHGHAILGTAGHSPGHPSHEPVDGVAVLDLVEGGLGAHLLEGVATVAEPIGPRGQDLAATAVAPFVGFEPVDNRLAGHRVGPQRRADLADDGSLLAVADHPLVTGRRRGLSGPGLVVCSWRRHGSNGLSWGQPGRPVW